MKKVFFLLTTLLISVFSVKGQSPYKQSPSKEGGLKQAEQFMQSQKQGFEENKGQVTGEDSDRVKYTYKDKGLSIFLLDNGMAYQFSKTHYPNGYKQLDKFAEPEEQEKMEALSKDIRVETYRMDVSLIGANENPTISTEGKSTDYTQYYNHNALNVHNYSKITYHEVYPNIDWVIYSKEGKNIKYDFVVHPGGDPNQIKLQTNWVEDLNLNKDGSLTLKNRMGNITEQTPVSFQGGRTLSTKFDLENDQISFDVSNYNTGKTLIIDPDLQWATYYGGSGEEFGYSCAVDGLGNVYLAGYTESTSSIAAGGHQNTYGGGSDDAFLVKFNSAGNRQWATYYGGDDLDRGSVCAVDGLGNVYLAGYTESTSSISSGGYQNTFGGMKDGFLVKFNSAGIRQWATYYGGSGEDRVSNLIVGSSGNLYLVGLTSSNSSIASGGHQNAYGGGFFDAFLVKFNSIGSRQWATYYGGGGFDTGRGCTEDGAGNIYLSGYTNSPSSIASGGHQNTMGVSGSAYGDAFLVKFNNAGIRQWGTYYGGTDLDQSSSCTVDGSGNVYLTGWTSSTSSIASSGHQNTFGGGASDAFLVKFNASGVRQWGTYYGDSGGEYGYSCAVDGSGNVYLVGATSSNSSIADGGYQNTLGGASDAFIVRFNSTGIRQWATYYGGSGSEFGYSFQIDGSGNWYLAGLTTSFSSIASGGYQNIHGGGMRDAFLAKFCTPTTGTDTQTACDSYTWIDGNTYTASNNTATQTLTNAAGCDSIVTLDLTINSPNVSVMNNSPELISNATPATYQWLNCEDNYALIAGETGPSFTASENGIYAVVVTENGCTDTSACEVVTNVGLNELNSEHLKLFPNPTIGKVSISHSSIIKSIRVIDPTGRIIKDDNYDQHEVDIDLGSYSTGVYTLEILTSGGVIQRKLIKK